MPGLICKQGFTLVEMLISIVLSSIIFVSSYQVISNLIQYQVRARVQHEKQLDKLLLKNMVSQIIEKSLHQYDLFYRAQKKSLFIGEEDSMQLISRAYSNHYDVPGYRVYRLFYRDGELYVSYRKYDGDYKSNNLFELPTGLKIEDINFEYFSADGWADNWHDDDSLPQYIRVSIDLPGTETMQWVRGTRQR